MTFKTLTVSLNKTSYPPINLGKSHQKVITPYFLPVQCAIDY